MIQHIYRKQIEEMKKECADVYVKKDVIKLAGVITENEEIIRYAEEHKEEEVLNMCEATKQWEEEIGRRKHKQYHQHDGSKERRRRKPCT